MRIILPSPHPPRFSCFILEFFFIILSCGFLALTRMCIGLPVVVYYLHFSCHPHFSTTLSFSFASPQLTIQPSPRRDISSLHHFSSSLSVINSLRGTAGCDGMAPSGIEGVGGHGRFILSGHGVSSLADDPSTINRCSSK